MDRLTEKQTENFYSGRGNDLGDILLKLGKLEDIMEKYGIESVEELENILRTHIGMAKLQVANFIKENELKHERDTWKKACELACESIAEDYVSYTTECFTPPNAVEEKKKEQINYFHQQAQKEIKE